MPCSHGLETNKIAVHYQAVTRIEYSHQMADKYHISDSQRLETADKRTQTATYSHSCNRNHNQHSVTNPTISTIQRCSTCLINLFKAILHYVITHQPPILSRISKPHRLALIIQSQKSILSKTRFLNLSPPWRGSRYLIL